MGSMKKHASLIHAERVLKLVRSRWRTLADNGVTEGIDATIGTWSNNREQGLFIRTHTLSRDYAITRLGHARSMGLL